MMVNVWKKAENLSQGRHNPLYDQIDSDNTMNTERFDDAMAALTFTAMAVTIALGFLFHL
jgi:CRISPR/Cas system CSM-associated protein Csm2 small subunit